MPCAAAGDSRGKEAARSRTRCRCVRHLPGCGAEPCDLVARRSRVRHTAGRRKPAPTSQPAVHNCRQGRLLNLPVHRNSPRPWNFPRPQGRRQNLGRRSPCPYRSLPSKCSGRRRGFLHRNRGDTCAHMLGNILSAHHGDRPRLTQGGRRAALVHTVPCGRHRVGDIRRHTGA